MPESDAADVEFRPTMGFIALGVFSPTVLIFAGSWGLIRAGEVRVLPTILLVLGIFMALVAAFDIPIRIRVDSNGVHRACVARTQVFPWDDVVAFRRPRGRRGRRGVSAQATSAPTPAGAMGNPETGKGGLILETTERRQYLLSTGRERPDTYVAIEAAVTRYAPGLSMPGPPYYPRSESSL